MGKTCQPLECLDAVYGAARSGCGGLEPGLDWGLGVGTVLVYAGKVWFLDRMVWLYEDMKDSTTEYSSWLYNNNAESDKCSGRGRPRR